MRRSWITPKAVARQQSPPAFQGAGDNRSRSSVVDTMTKERFSFRLLRIACVVLSILHLWSSSRSGVVSTSMTIELGASGHLFRKTEALIEEPLQQLRQPNEENKGYGQHQPSPADLNGRFADSDENEDKCGLYLAPSTIEGAGLGMFTSRPRLIVETVGFGEVVIPMVEVAFYSGNKAELFNPFKHYYWKGPEKGLHGIISDRRIDELQGFVPGLDAAVNCNLALINVDMSGAEYDGGNLNRNRDPMAGGMTPYHTTPSPVIRDIPAGGELFKFYGDRWFIARENLFGLLPLSNDYPAAQKIVDNFDGLRKNHFSTNPELKAELWSFVKDTIGKDIWESRIMNALPNTAEDAEKASDSGIASLHQPQAIRSSEFLRQHGKCMDSIRPGPSTLDSRQAGRGGFATRDFAMGQIITGSPLHHMPNKELVTIYHMELTDTDSITGGETWVRHRDTIVGYQMILNYCYGHPQSTLLLCPYGSNIGYINHNQTRANVRIQWAADGVTLHNQTWLQSKQLEDMYFDYKVGLAFDYVATKDIQEGEELFLDYGDQFEEAITNYLSNWRQPPSATSANYTPAEIFNKEVANWPLRTVGEEESDPYPENLEIRCHPGVAERHANNSRQPNGDFIWDARDAGYPCQILERYRKLKGGDSDHFENVYKVELTLPLNEVGHQLRRDRFNYVQRKGVGRSAIKFFNKPYTTDLFLPNTFRKAIGIPDEIFPAHWKNTNATNQQDKRREFSIPTPYR